MSEEIRFVIVGSGNISNTYRAVLDKLPDASLTAVVSRGGREGTGFPADLEVAESLAAVRSPFDAVILATPNGLHHRGAIEAAELGKHVLTEKPLDVTREAMDRMIDACERAGVRLGVTYQRRTSPDNRAVHDLIHQGKLGRIFAADVTVKNYRDPSYYESADYRGSWEADGGGPFMMQAIHMIDLYGWFFGPPDNVLSAYGTFCHEIEVEDHGAAILEHGSRMIGTIIASTATQPGSPGKIDIHSDRGSVTMENDRITYWGIEGVDNPATEPEQTIHSGATSASVSDLSGHEMIVADFAEAIRKDRPPMIDGNEARLATEIILQIYGL